MLTTVETKTVEKLYVAWNKFNVVGVLTSGNHTKEMTTKLY